MRRITRAAFVAAATMALSGCWLAPGQGPNRQAFNGLETAINTDTVATLQLQWTGPLGQLIPPQGPGDPVRWADPSGTPIVVPGAGSVYVNTGNSVHAFAIGSGVQRWEARTDPVSQRFSPELFALADGRLVGSHFSYKWYDSLWLNSATGQRIQGPAGNLPHSVRGHRLLTYLLSEAPYTGDWYQAAHLVDLEAGTTTRIGWLNRNTTEVSPARMTLGDTRFFHVGVGLMVTTPGDATSGYALRGLPISGASNCGPEPYYVCPDWVRPLDGTVGTTPVLSDDGATLYVGTDAGTLYAVDTATGAVRWSTPVGSGVTTEPALAYGTLFVPTASGSLVAIDAADGASRWATATGSRLGVQPAVAGHVVVTGADDGAVRAFGTADGSPLWAYAAGSKITGAPALAAGHLFVGTEDARLLAFAPSP